MATLCELTRLETSRTSRVHMCFKIILVPLYQLIQWEQPNQEVPVKVQTHCDHMTIERSMLEWPLQVQGLS